MKKIAKNALFDHIFQKINTSTFWCMITSHGPGLVHVRFTPNERPKGFKISFLRNLTMEV